MPASCTAVSASAICAPMRATSAGGSGPRSASTAASEREGRYSMTSHGIAGWVGEGAVTTSKTAMARGCTTRAAIRPSRIARLRAVRTSTGSPSRGGVSCLTATVRASRRSHAVQTTPMAPAPMHCSMR